MTFEAFRFNLNKNMVFELIKPTFSYASYKRLKKKTAPTYFMNEFMLSKLLCNTTM